MPKIAVEKLKPGMKLAKPVVNESGMILLGEGTELTEARIDRLNAMNIQSVDIEGAAKPQKTKEEMLADIAQRFSKTEHEPYMGVLKRLFLEHIEEMNA